MQDKTGTNSTPIAHIDLDHTYCTSFSDDHDHRMTPQRRDVCSIQLRFIRHDASIPAFGFLLQSTNGYRSDSSAGSPRSVRTPDHSSMSNAFDPRDSVSFHAHFLSYRIDFPSLLNRACRRHRSSSHRGPNLASSTVFERDSTSRHEWLLSGLFSFTDSYVFNEFFCIISIFHSRIL